MNCENYGKVTLITGPMWGGKTTELFKILNMYQSVLKENEIILIRFSKSTERQEEERIIPGLDKRIKIIETNKINLDLIKNYIDKIKVIGIDEGQFFSDLRSICLCLSDTFLKKVIVSGLNSDFNRNEFREISSLLPICDEIILKHSLCMECKDGTPGIFSMRTCQCGDQIQIGGSDIYKTVCRKHYNYFNRKDH